MKNYFNLQTDTKSSLKQANFFRSNVITMNSLLNWQIWWYFINPVEIYLEPEIKFFLQKLPLWWKQVQCTAALRCVVCNSSKARMGASDTLLARRYVFPRAIKTDLPCIFSCVNGLMHLGAIIKPRVIRRRVRIDGRFITEAERVNMISGINAFNSFVNSIMSECIASASRLKFFFSSYAY